MAEKTKVDIGAEKWRRKAPRMVKNYKAVMKPEKAEEFRKGVARAIGVTPDKINDAIVGNYREVIPLMEESYEAKVKPELADKWKSRYIEKFTLAVE